MGIVSQIMFKRVTLSSITAVICEYIDNEEYMGTNLTPSLTSFQTDSTVSPAPKQFLLNSNSNETFQFQDNDIAISYLSTSPHLVGIILYGDIGVMRINHNTKYLGKHCGYYAKKGNIDCSTKPVVRMYDEVCEKIRVFDIWK